MKPLTETQQRILNRIKSSKTPVARSEIGIASQTHIAVTLRTLLEASPKIIYIAAWGTPQTGTAFFAKYLAGDLPDAPKPVADRSEILRRKRERARARSYREVGPDMYGEDARPPPTLPAFNPAYGFWGI